MKKITFPKRFAAMTMAATLTLAAPCTVFAAPPDLPSGTEANGDAQGGAPGGAPGGQSSSSNITWSGAKTITSATTEDSQTYSSTTADENALLVNTSDAVTITNPTVTKSGGTSASDDYSFYGINSGVMAKGGGTTTITGGTVNTTAEGANGVFSYGANSGQTNATGDGTTVNISGTEITTTGNGSGGIMTTYGGTTNAKNLTVNTSGGSSAAIRTDRGGGWVNVDGGTYTSTGQGSPAIYSTADVNVSNATLNSTKSEGVCIEGTGSVELTNCNLTDNNTSLNGNAKFQDAIMIYQSMSGDASDGTSEFTMTGGSLTAKAGDTFHVTNTTAKINLDNVKITNSDTGALISVCDDGWSSNSTNGNAAVLTATDQTLDGDMLVGDDSSLNVSLSGSTVYTGKTSGSITDASGNTVSTNLGTVNMAIYSGSTWVLTGDCSVSSLTGSGKINYNGHKLTVGSTTYSSGSIGDITETTETASSSTTDTTTTDTTTDTTKTDTTTDTTKTDTTKTDTTTTTTKKAVTFKNTSVRFKVKTLKKKKISYSIIKKSGGGKVTVIKYSSKKAKKYISVSNKGVVTVKKGTPKGTYTLKVKVAAKGSYKATAKTIKVVVK